MEIRHSLWERIWHWFQAGIILLLLITGFQMHYPDQLIFFKDLANNFNLHVMLGAALLINSILGLFYQLTTGAIIHFIPGLDDILYGAMKQVKYYLSGIFRHENPPHTKNKNQRLNPLQKIAYLVLLILLIPLQLLSGILLVYGAEYWPIIFNRLGGLRIIAPIHTLLAFVFLSFFIVHIYLSTTGDTPLGLLQEMVFGERRRKS